MAIRILCLECRAPLQRQATELLWRCIGCDTAASTLAVTRSSKGAAVAKQLWRAAIREGKPSRPCPACKQMMQAVECTSPHDVVELDICTVCQLVWFDAGEHGRLPPAKQLSQQAQRLVRALEVELEEDRPRAELAEILRTPVSGEAFAIGALLSVAADLVDAVFDSCFRSD